MSNQLRTQKIIEKDFQISIIGGFTGLIFVLALIFITVLFFLKVYTYWLLPEGAPILFNLDFENVILATKQDNGFFIEDSVGDYFLINTNQKISGYNAFQLYLYPVLFISLLNILSIFIFSLYFSNRIAGPIYRIKNELSKYMDSGSYVPIILRRKDFLQDVVLLLNRLFVKIDIKNSISNNTKQVEDQLKLDTKPKKK